MHDIYTEKKKKCSNTVLYDTTFCKQHSWNELIITCARIFVRIEKERVNERER